MWPIHLEIQPKSLLASQDFTFTSQDFTFLLKTSPFFFQLHFSMAYDPSSMCSHCLLLLSISKTSTLRESSNQANLVPESYHQLLSLITIDLREVVNRLIVALSLSLPQLQESPCFNNYSEIYLQNTEVCPAYDGKFHPNLVMRFTP